MSLLDSLGQPDPVRRPAPSHPKGFEPGVRYDTGEVTLLLPEPPSEEEQGWRAEITRHTGLSLREDQRVRLTDVRYWGPPDAPNVYARYKIEEASPALDLDELVRTATVNAEAGATERWAYRETRQVTPEGQHVAYVVAWADLQVGKVDHRGDTPALVQRVLEKIESVEAQLATIGPDDLYVIDAGDCVEGFENHAAQLFTNDLSLPEQLRVARRLFTEAVTRWSKYAGRVVVTGVPSNHARWRRGKGSLGRSGDDFGLETLTAVHDALQLAGDAYAHVHFVIPDPWEESLTLDVNGLAVGVVHGHQVRNPDAFPKWWAGQQHGAQPLAQADLVLTGHFHHLRVQPTGRSVHSGRSKWWIQAPTLDNGSSWWRHASGDDSDPGLLTFLVTSAGWSDLKIH